MPSNLMIALVSLWYHNCLSIAIKRVCAPSNESLDDYNSLLINIRGRDCPLLRFLRASPLAFQLPFQRSILVHFYLSRTLDLRLLFSAIVEPSRVHSSLFFAVSANGRSSSLLAGLSTQQPFSHPLRSDLAHLISLPCRGRARRKRRNATRLDPTRTTPRLPRDLNRSTRNRLTGNSYGEIVFPTEYFLVGHRDRSRRVQFAINTRSTFPINLKLFILQDLLQIQIRLIIRKEKLTKL